MFRNANKDLIEIKINKMRGKIGKHIEKLEKQIQNLGLDNTTDRADLSAKSKGLQYVLDNSTSMTTCDEAVEYVLKTKASQYGLNLWRPPGESSYVRSGLFKEARLVTNLKGAYIKENTNAYELKEIPTKPKV